MGYTRASDIVTRWGAALADYGEAMTLARAGETAISLKGQSMTGGIEQIGGSAEQQRFRVRIGTAELAASSWASKAPTMTDTLTVDGRVRTILNVQSLNVGNTTVLYELELAG